jgi:hypothetical protein
LGTDSVPNRKNYLTSADLPRYKAVELALGPVLLEERGTQDYRSESGSAETVVDFLAQAVPERQFKLVQPHAEATALHLLREGFCDFGLIFARVADEKVDRRLVQASGGGRRSCRSTLDEVSHRIDCIRQCSAIGVLSLNFVPLRQVTSDVRDLPKMPRVTGNLSGPTAVRPVPTPEEVALSIEQEKSPMGSVFVSSKDSQ